MTAGAVRGVVEAPRAGRLPRRNDRSASYRQRRMNQITSETTIETITQVVIGK